MDSFSCSPWRSFGRSRRRPSIECRLRHRQGRKDNGGHRNSQPKPGEAVFEKERLRRFCRTTGNNDASVKKQQRGEKIGPHSQLFARLDQPWFASLKFSPRLETGAAVKPDTVNRV
jgi:hypothetical protein